MVSDLLPRQLVERYRIAVSVADLASVANLSIFYFTRAFSSAMAFRRTATSVDGAWNGQ
jgi:AraC-like DNA-binding protein